MNSEEELVEYGPVKIIKGKYKGAIGFLIIVKTDWHTFIWGIWRL